MDGEKEGEMKGEWEEWMGSGRKRRNGRKKRNGRRKRNRKGRRKGKKEKGK